jgi:hypothetical protein
MVAVMKRRAQITKQERRGTVSEVFDLGASAEATHIARDKDRLVGDAVWEEYLEETGRKPRTRRKAES